jgi:hypothetical protein
VLVLAAALLIAAPASAQLSIDSFLDPFPPNPDLPVSGRTILFVGGTCDGSACPPGTFVTHTGSDATSQTGLAGVIGGERDAEIVQTAGTANVVVVQGLLCHNHNSGASSEVFLDYGSTQDMNADLTIGLATAIEVEVTGDMYAGPRPVPLTITVTSARGTGSEATASSTQSLINDGVYSFAFTDFTGVDFTDVDAISLHLDASAVSAVDYCLLNFQTDGTPVAVEHIHFGHLKSLYR